MRTHIHFLHAGRASYPEIAAYARYFEPRATVSDGLLEACPPLDPDTFRVNWCIMGVYPARQGADFVIHDYRSLSVGRLAALKDRMKRLVNARPDLRIFQNSKIREVLGFQDEVPSAYLPMGVPEWIGQVDQAEKKYDFGYLGAVNEDRGFDRIFESFLRRYDSQRTMLVVGPCEDALLKRWDAVPALEFRGAMPQREALEQITAARVALALFPSHRPHCWQTPTKLLEYAALRLPIVANDSQMVREVAGQLSIPVKFIGETLFDDPALSGDLWDESFQGDFSQLYWPSVIAESGVENAIFNGNRG